MPDQAAAASPSTDHATSFGRAANAYQQGRPSYPPDAVEWMLEGCHDVVDVGAGTGKLTAVIAASGRDVVAIDPDPAMLAQLAEALPQVPTAQGRGESIPLPDASRDAATFGQCWHWVDPRAASREVARVLRPGGTLGLIWNIRDDSIEWVARLSALFTSYRGADTVTRSWDPPIDAPFAALERVDWHWSAPMTRERMRAMAESRSHVIALGDVARAELLARLDALLDSLLDDPDLTDPDGVLNLPYVTHAYRARLTHP